MPLCPRRWGHNGFIQINSFLPSKEVFGGENSSIKIDWKYKVTADTEKEALKACLQRWRRVIEEVVIRACLNILWEKLPNARHYWGKNYIGWANSNFLFNCYFRLKGKWEKQRWEWKGEIKKVVIGTYYSYIGFFQIEQQSDDDNPIDAFLKLLNSWIWLEV